MWGDALLEQLISQTLRKSVQRGSLIVSVREEGSSANRHAVHVNHELGRAYARGFLELSGLLGGSLGALDPQLALSQSDELHAKLLGLVAMQPGVVSLGEASLDAEQRFRSLEPILEAAATALLAARQREGEALSQDLQQRLQLLHRLVDESTKLVEGAPEAHRKRLSERIARLLDGVTAVDSQRLAQEVAMLADRVDVTEEITRLRAHMVEFRRLCLGDGLAGRQLDFLTQEMSREVNTIGSKSQSAEVAARVVAMKAELERLREQIQNVE
jgi:uncharacterized protein (TIGR00255 family)